jgi:hypothetical protein
MAPWEEQGSEFNLPVSFGIPRKNILHHHRRSTDANRHGPKTGAGSTAPKGESWQPLTWDRFNRLPPQAVPTLYTDRDDKG